MKKREKVILVNSLRQSKKVVQDVKLWKKTLKQWNQSIDSSYTLKTVLYLFYRLFNRVSVLQYSVIQCIFSTIDQTTLSSLFIMTS